MLLSVQACQGQGKVIDSEHGARHNSSLSSEKLGSERPEKPVCSRYFAQCVCVCVNRAMCVLRLVLHTWLCVYEQMYEDQRCRLTSNCLVAHSCELWQLEDMRRRGGRGRWGGGEGRGGGGGVGGCGGKTVWYEPRSYICVPLRDEGDSCSRQRQHSRKQTLQLSEGGLSVSGYEVSMFIRTKVNR